MLNTHYREVKKNTVLKKILHDLTRDISILLLPATTNS